MKVPTLKAELGKSQYYECLLENPTELDVFVSGEIVANKPGFGVEKSFTIGPHSETKTQIWFTPTDIDINEVHFIVFISIFKVS